MVGKQCLRFKGWRGGEEHNLEFGKLNCVVIRDDDREAMDGCVNVMFKQQR